MKSPIPSFFDLSDHLSRLSADGDPLEELEALIDFEALRPVLLKALNYGDGKRGGRPHFDPVAMFKAMILQVQHNLSDARTEFMIRDRLSWMRFLGFDLGAPMPDENTIRHFRNRLTDSGVLSHIMAEFEGQLVARGYVAKGGQIIDASLIPAPKQRNTHEEKEAIKVGKNAKQIWPHNPNKACQKDTDARWTIKIGGKLRLRPDGTPLAPISIPSFGYKSHISVDRAFGFIRGAQTTSANVHDGRGLEGVLHANKHAQVWADTAYRSAKNEAMLADKGLISRIHHKRPRGKAMDEDQKRANRERSRIRARVEHPFAQQKAGDGLLIRTIGLARAKTKITLANLIYNFQRLRFWERKLCLAT